MQQSKDSKNINYKANTVPNTLEVPKDDHVVKPVAVTAFDCRPPLGSLYSMVPANQPFWVFGYGSLIWRPGFDYIQKAKVKLMGYHRALCIHSWHHRGTKEDPGLVFGLDAGGYCEGVAFQIAPENRETVLDYLYDRELISYCYMPMRLPMAFEDGSVCHALSFVANPQDNQYCEPLPVQEISETVNRAVGQSGANKDYIVNTFEHLKSLDIEDDWLENVVKAL